MLHSDIAKANDTYRRLYIWPQLLDQDEMPAEIRRLLRNLDYGLLLTSRNDDKVQGMKRKALCR